LYANAAVELKLATRANRDQPEAGRTICRCIKGLCQSNRVGASGWGIANDLGLVYFNIGSYAEAKKALSKHSIATLIMRARTIVWVWSNLDLGDIKLVMEEHSELTDLNEKQLSFQLLDKIQLESRQAS